MNLPLWVVVVGPIFFVGVLFMAMAAADNKYQRDLNRRDESADKSLEASLRRLAGIDDGSAYSVRLRLFDEKQVFGWLYDQFKGR